MRTRPASWLRPLCAGPRLFPAHAEDLKPHTVVFSVRDSCMVLESQTCSNSLRTETPELGQCLLGETEADSSEVTRMSRSYVAQERWDPEREPSPGTKRPWEAVAWPWPQGLWGGCWSSLILGHVPPSLSSEGTGKATCSHPHGRAPPPGQRWSPRKQR